MKLFINDWHGSMDTFDMNTSENREYPINEWIEAGGGKRMYLVSAYVYDEFVMFFYMYDLSYHPEYIEPEVFKMPRTQRESIEERKKHENRFRVHFEYEVNHLKYSRGRCDECWPKPMPDASQQKEMDELAKMFFGEYGYLCDLMKETGRIPDELKGKELMFRKDCYSFEKPIDEINHIAIYPPKYESRTCYIDKTFIVPYGACDIKLPYTLTDTGEESYIVIKELKIYDMLEEFEKVERNYDAFQKAYEQTLADDGKNKENHGQNDRIVSLEERKRIYDKRILRLSFLKPEEKRSFTFYTAEYLESPIPTGSMSASSTGFIFRSEDQVDGELYKAQTSLGESDGAPKDGYEITLMSVTDALQNERKAVFERGGAELTANL